MTYNQAICREYYKEHREEILEKRREYYEANRERIKARQREYAAKHREEKRLYDKKRNFERAEGNAIRQEKTIYE